MGCEGDVAAAATTTTLGHQSSPSVVAIGEGVAAPRKPEEETTKSSRLTLFQNVSRVFSRVCSSMFSSSDHKTLPPGTLATLSDSLDDLKRQL